MSNKAVRVRALHLSISRRIKKYIFKTFKSQNKIDFVFFNGFCSSFVSNTYINDLNFCSTDFLRIETYLWHICNFTFARRYMGIRKIQLSLHCCRKMDSAIEEIIHSHKYNTLPSLFDFLQTLFKSGIQTKDALTADLIDKDFLEEIKSFVYNKRALLYFGKTLRDFRCLITDEDCLREHEISFQYKGPKMLSISSVSFPYSTLQDVDYSTLDNIVNTFQKHLNSLAGYFNQLECIDRNCTVMEPVNPTFKEDYRKILLDDRIWLHVEVTPQGLATNIHLIGQSEKWQNKLQEGLLKWDHDIDIVNNIMNIFDIVEFPVLANTSVEALGITEKAVEKPVCSICLCDELPDLPGVPLPLCQNPICGIYFHRNCLYEWLVACSGGRPPVFGVATGSCPQCLQPVTCNEKDS